MDATDNLVHGNQEGRFLHGYYNSYRHLPQYIFCEDYLPAARLRPSSIDACLGTDTELARIVTQIRERSHEVKTITRGDSGFAGEWLMKWCENNAGEYLFGPEMNSRLRKAIEAEMQQARLQYARSAQQ